LNKKAIVSSLCLIVLAAAACATPLQEDIQDEMSFSEEEASEDVGEELESAEDEAQAGDEMEFTEEELDESEELEFSEEELDSDVPPDGMELIIPIDGTWTLHYEPGYVQCGTGPYVEGADSLQESVSLLGLGEGESFEMHQSGQDRTLSFHVVYNDEFLDPFADNFVNYTHPADNLLAFHTAAYQMAFHEGGAGFYMVLFPTDPFTMIGTFWVLQGDCQLEKFVEATRQ
jgi:hypothetical protein